jgi:glycosyltransferase involved in cell wall biosynthesis
MGGLIDHSATDVLACSPGAAQALLGERRARPGRYLVVPYGINLGPFSRSGGGAELRRDHGIPEGVPVIGHVGRMSAEKNHLHLLEVAHLLLQRVPDAKVVLIGAGYLKPEIIERAKTLGIAGSVVFPDPATDHLRWMTDVFDAFVFPSLAEGIPLALIEAQAAGLPCIISDEAVPPEIEIIPSLIHRVSLTAGIEAWVAAVAAAIRGPRIPVAQATATVAASQFNIEQSRLAVEQVYHARVRAAAS